MNQIPDAMIVVSTLLTIMIQVPNWFNKKNQPECSFDLYTDLNISEHFEEIIIDLGSQSAMNFKPIQTKKMNDPEEFSFDLYKFPNENDLIFEVQEDFNSESIQNLY